MKNKFGLDDSFWDMSVWKVLADRVGCGTFASIPFEDQFSKSESQIGEFQTQFGKNKTVFFFFTYWPIEGPSRYVNHRLFRQGDLSVFQGRSSPWHNNFLARAGFEPPPTKVSGKLSLQNIK